MNTNNLKFMFWRRLQNIFLYMVYEYTQSGLLNTWKKECQLYTILPNSDVSVKILKWKIYLSLFLSLSVPK